MSVITATGRLAISGLLRDLAAYWRLYELDGPRYDVLERSNLAPTNVPVQVAGPLDYGVQFTIAAADNLACASNPALVLGGGSFTLAAWVRIDVLPGGGARPLISKAAAGLADGEYALGVGIVGADPRLEWEIWHAPAAGLVTQTPVIALATWYHITAWHDMTNQQLGIQLNDGSPIITHHPQGAQAGANSLTIGTLAGASASSSSVANLGLWKRVLSAAEILELYNAGAGQNYPW